MASKNEDQPTAGTKSNPAVDDIVVITDSIGLPTNLDVDDGKTTTSSLTSIDGITNASTSFLSPASTHKSYQVLTSCGRPQLKTMS